MTAVEEIRQAAALMRERAEKATPGPWHMDENQAIYGEDGTYVTRPWTSDERDPDLPHIASWHPQVALAVADWLDAWIVHAERNSLRPAEDVGPLAVARAYLGRAEQ